MRNIFDLLGTDNIKDFFMVLMFYWYFLGSETYIQRENEELTPLVGSSVQQTQVRVRHVVGLAKFR
jgi:hypothetical protein